MVTTRDYQAAEQLLRRPALPGELVTGDRIKPQWIEGLARFWYGVSNGVGVRFVLVDPAAGVREPAFDHARLAASRLSPRGSPRRRSAVDGDLQVVVTVPGPRRSGASPLGRAPADRLQGHAARVHALEQADSGAEQHG